ncbi:hypothetical protein H6G07_24950 [Phormidium tenue FACHB-1052]|uniref:Uncharacterized protein n=1 Tax=Phormidium tenue NIES-30 TaxID=549789 RepID=A0A1U7IXR8_9CYAN|nr:hypothetical protein [Phormidium tenue FACHB-1052]OKH42908.1 hypothetical protein NIES30_25785 [Phormidium tenue NIES-30]
MDIGKGSEGAEFVRQSSRAVDDGLHLLRVDGVSGIEGQRIVERSDNDLRRRVAKGILVPFIGLGQGSAAIEGGDRIVNA